MLTFCKVFDRLLPHGYVLYAVLGAPDFRSQERPLERASSGLMSRTEFENLCTRTPSNRDSAAPEPPGREVLRDRIAGLLALYGVPSALHRWLLRTTLTVRNCTAQR